MNVKKDRFNFDDLPDWLTPLELRKYLRLSKTTMYDLIRSGEIPFRRFGRQYRISKEWVGSLSVLPASTSENSPARHRGKKSTADRYIGGPIDDLDISDIDDHNDEWEAQ